MTKKQAVQSLIGAGVVVALLLLLGFTQEATSDDPFAYFTLVLMGVVLLPVLWLSSFVLANLWGFTIFNAFIFVLLRKIFNFTKEIFKTATIFVYWVGWRQVWFAFKNESSTRPEPRPLRPSGNQSPGSNPAVPPTQPRVEPARHIKRLLGNREEKR